MKLSDLSHEQQVIVLKSLCDTLHNQLRELQIHNDPKNYGVTLMTKEHRLINRLHADFVITDMGIAPHDEEAQMWLHSVLNVEQRF